ncbi:MAG: putative nitrogen fixation protein NifT [Nitrospinae bacterium]|nr:putative nitrogen fixation protein NifT [Nitrospinota bacterium]
MKVTVRESGGSLSIYIPKKDLELKVVATDPNHTFGGTLELQGGMKLYVEPLLQMPQLPLTLEARKL